jgi:II/X family phage/plasmid replication protein
MIDWITIRIPCSHATPINGGKFVSISSDGEEEWNTDKFLPVEGSYSSKISIRSLSTDIITDNNRFTHIELSGNPVKFLQGHNIWGTDSLLDLICECYIEVLTKINLPHLYNFDDVLKGQLTRVDINYMYHLDSANSVNNWLRSLEQSATLKHRGKGQFNHGTLYFGKGSKHWLLKMYHKGQEIKANSKHQRKDILNLPFVKEFADKSLRIELQLRSKELKKIELNMASAWNEKTPKILYNRYLSLLDISENTMTIEDSRIQELPRIYQSTYRLWATGHDIRTMYSKNTYYKHRRFIIGHLNVDIAIKQKNVTPDLSNVIPLVRTLEAVPVSTPEWAIGTDLYFEPRYFSSK